MIFEELLGISRALESNLELAEQIGSRKVLKCNLVFGKFLKLFDISKVLKSNSVSRAFLRTI